MNDHSALAQELLLAGIEARRWRWETGVGYHQRQREPLAAIGYDPAMAIRAWRERDRQRAEKAQRDAQAWQTRRLELDAFHTDEFRPEAAMRK